MVKASSDLDAGRVIIAGASADRLAALSRVLEGDGHRVSAVETPSAAIETMSSRNPDVMLVCGGDAAACGRAELARMRDARPETQICLLAGPDGLGDACSLAREGLADFVESAASAPEVVALLVRRAVERRRLRAQLAQVSPGSEGGGALAGVIGASLSMREVARSATQIGLGNAHVVIEGEVGSGRGTLGAAIHFEGPRKDEPFLRLRCTESAEEVARVFGEAGQGTLLLEAVDTLRGDAQRALLAVLESQDQQVIQQSGAAAPRARIVALTSVDLDLQVQRGLFDGQLFRRLKGASVRMPPLRERREDIPALVQHFMEKHAREGVATKGVEPSAVNLLCQYDWPGNVQELEDCIRYAIAVAGSQVIEIDHLPEKVVEASQQRIVTESGGALSLKGYEKHTVEHALSLCDGDILRAAKMLGIGRSTLYRKMKSHGIRRRAFRRHRQPPG
ncbi:MAG: sigma-54-dependent transcriptional regulator [Myxococcota bacterium]